MEVKVVLVAVVSMRLVLLSEARGHGAGKHFQW